MCARRTLEFINHIVFSISVRESLVNIIDIIHGTQYIPSDQHYLRVLSLSRHYYNIQYQWLRSQAKHNPVNILYTLNSKEAQADLWNALKRVTARTVLC